MDKNIQNFISGCEITKCRFFKNEKCMDPNDYVNADNELVCGIRDDAILIPSSKLRSLTAKQPICSIDHFKRLQKFFRKVAMKQITTNPKFQEQKLKQLVLSTFWENDLPKLDAKLLKVFKCNPYKTKSGFTEKTTSLIYDHPITWYVSYTVENNFKRTSVSEEAYLVYRIYMKIGNGQKRRVIRIKVQMDWLINKYL